MRRPQLFLLIFGLVLVGLGIFLMTTRHTDYLPVQAVITRIEQEGGADDTSYRVYVNYTVDGKEYKDAVLGEYLAGYRVGKEITVMYDPQDPGRIESKNQGLFAIIVTAAGGIAAIAGAIGILKRGLV